MKVSPEDRAGMPIPEKLAGQEIAFEGRIDINDDGRTESVYVVNFPSGLSDVIVLGREPDQHRFERLYLYDASLNEIKYTTGGTRRWKSTDSFLVNRYRVLRYRGGHYVIALVDDAPRYVGTFDADNSAHALCAFHGADARLADGSEDLPLELALDAEDPALILRLIEASADAAQAADDIARFAECNRAEGIEIIKAATKASRAIPESFVIYAIEENPELLDYFAMQRLPILSLGIEWRDGVRTAMSWWTRQALTLNGDGAIGRKVQRLFARGTIAPRDRYAIASYGPFDAG